jgi:hypothetical protein
VSLLAVAVLTWMMFSITPFPRLGTGERYA